MGGLCDVEFEFGGWRFNKVWANACQNHWEVLIRC